MSREGDSAETTDPLVWLRFALECAAEADRLAEAAFGTVPRVVRKPDLTYVTETDVAIEQAIRQRIERSFPDHGIVGEELAARVGESGLRWYIDPIDGTHNFLRGIPIFATLLALERDGVLEVAVVSAPALRRRWHAVRGQGAALSIEGSPPQPIRISDVATLEEAQILYSSPARLMRDVRLPGFASVLDRCWRERGFGDFWGYMLVAEGAAEAMIEVGIQPYDLAAPVLIVEEAGGVVTNFQGLPDRSGESVLAGNRLLHPELLRALRTPADDVAIASASEKRPS